MQTRGNTDLRCRDCGAQAVEVTRIGVTQNFAIECLECGARVIQHEREFARYGEEGDN